MQHIHENNGKTFLLVEIEKEYTQFKISGVNYLCLNNAYPPTWATSEHYKLPPGCWQIIAKASEVTEEHAKEIVKVGKMTWRKKPCFISYDNCGECQFAKDSLFTLLRCYFMQPETTLILQKI